MNPFNPLIARFTLEKETPGTYRYAEDGEPSAHKIGTLYVKKRAFFDGPAPTQITVTVEVGS